MNTQKSPPGGCPPPSLESEGKPPDAVPRGSDFAPLTTDLILGQGSCID